MKVVLVEERRREGDIARAELTQLEVHIAMNAGDIRLSEEFSPVCLEGPRSCPFC